MDCAPEVAAAQARAVAGADFWPAPATARIGFDVGGGAGQGVVDFAMFPATVGGNEVHLSVLDAAGTLLDASETSVTLTLQDRSLGPLVVALRKLGAGHYIGTATIPMTGRWQLAVTVRTSEANQDTVTIPVDIR